MKQSTSGYAKLDKVDYLKTVRFLAVSAIGQFLIYSAQYVSGLDLGVYTPFVGMFASALIEVIRRYLTDHSDVK